MAGEYMSVVLGRKSNNIDENNKKVINTNKDFLNNFNKKRNKKLKLVGELVKGEPKQMQPIPQSNNNDSSNQPPSNQP